MRFLAGGKDILPFLRQDGEVIIPPFLETLVIAACIGKTHKMADTPGNDDSATLDVSTLPTVEDVDTGLDKSDTFFFVAYNSEQGGQEVGQAVPDKGITYWIGNQNPDGRWYVKTSADDQIFLASEEAVEKIYGVNPFDCILKVVNVVSVETVSRVEIVRGKDVYEMAVQDKTYKLGGKEVESSKFFDLYTALISIYIEKEIPEDSSEVESRDPLLSITYHRNMKEAPQITCSFYDYDENYASVNVNGTEFFLVNKSDLQKLDKIIDSAFA